MNKQQFNITNETRELKIINYIRSHGGCTKADITRGLKDVISKKTIDKIVDEMIRENKIIPQKEKENSRSIKLYVKEGNPAVYVPFQLEEIEEKFRRLLSKSQRYWVHLQKRKDSAWKESKLDLYIDLLEPTQLHIYFVPTMILRIITDSIAIHSTVNWMSKFQDKGSLNKLLSNVFMKLGSFNSEYLNYLNNIQHGHLDRVQFDDAAFNRILSPIQLMYASRLVYKKIGMQKEIEEVLESLWKFTNDIQKFLFSEIELYKWDFKYGVDDWKKLLEIYENNPNQTAHNFYTEKRDNTLASHIRTSRK